MKGEGSILTYDPTISLGIILQLVLLIAGVGILYGRLVAIETKLNALWNWYQSIRLQDLRGAQGPRGMQGFQGERGDAS